MQCAAGLRRPQTACQGEWQQGRSRAARWRAQQRTAPRVACTLARPRRLPLGGSRVERPGRQAGRQAGGQARPTRRSLVGGLAVAHVGRPPRHVAHIEALAADTAGGQGCAEAEGRSGMQAGRWAARGHGGAKMQRMVEARLQPLAQLPPRRTPAPQAPAALQTSAARSEARRAAAPAPTRGPAPRPCSAAARRTATCRSRACGSRPSGWPSPPARAGRYASRELVTIIAGLAVLVLLSGHHHLAKRTNSRERAGGGGGHPVSGGTGGAARQGPALGARGLGRAALPTSTSPPAPRRPPAPGSPPWPSWPAPPAWSRRGRAPWRRPRRPARP